MEKVKEPSSGSKTSKKTSSKAPSRHKTGIFNTGNQIRGKIADPVKIPVLLNFMGRMPVMVIWESIICIVIFVYFFIITYEPIFAYETGAWGYYLHAADMLFYFDLGIRLLAEIYRCHAKIDCTFFVIPFSFRFFVLTLLAIVPIETIYIYLDNPDEIDTLSNHDWLRFNRIFLYYRIIVYFSYLELEQQLSEFFVFVGQFFTLYIGFIQLVACALFIMTGIKPIDYMLREADDAERTWMELIELVKPGFIHTPFNHYILTLSFSTSVVTTVGYGDVSPKSVSEMIFCIIVMLVGAIGMAGIFGSNITGFFVERDGARFDLFYRVDVILKNLKRLGSSAIFAEKVKEYYTCLWNFREGVYHVNFMHYMPRSMLDDILYDICTEMFNKAILFRGLEEPFLRAVARVVEVVLYNPDMIICRQGDYAMTMFYIIQGECLVKARHNSNVTTAILRAGTIFGESSLFFSFPYASNVETRTCCQLLRVNKERLMDAFNEYVHVLNFMRARIQERMGELRQFYEHVGEHPITWVQFRPDIELLSLRPYSDYPTELRWAEGFNHIVTEDVVDDAESPIIVDMSCIDEEFEKDNTTVYGTCVIPPTLVSPHKWVVWWHVFIVCVALFSCFLGPYDLAFANTTEMSYWTTHMFWFIRYLITAAYFFDVLVEITTACPSSGIYYKFVDGFNIKVKSLSFYMDIFAGIPIEALASVVPSKYSTSVKLISTIAECFKLWKVRRFLVFLGDQFPNYLFLYRLMETAVMLMYFIHFLGCWMFHLACPPPEDAKDVAVLKGTAEHTRQCECQSWLSSYFITKLTQDGEMDYNLYPNSLANKYPYLISIYFATATLSSAGFGDFSPQTNSETIVVIFAGILGFFIIGYYTAVLTSALACNTRPKVFFQQQLVSVRQFLTINGMSECLKDRILEHYRLQFQYNEGIILPPGIKHLIFDSPPYLEEDYLFTEAEIHLEGVPIFTVTGNALHKTIVRQKVAPNVIIKAAQIVNRFVLPPNIYFVRRGDVHRQMYVIYKGSVAILKEDTDEVKAVLEATGHIGVRDLLMGEPSHNNVKTLSYCVIWAFDLEQFMEIFDNDEDLVDEVEKKKKENHEMINALTEVYAKLGKLYFQKERKPTQIHSWIHFPTRENPHADFCDYQEFEDGYKGTLGRLAKIFLMRRTIHPVGTFALCWNLTIGILSTILFLTLLIEELNRIHNPCLQTVQYVVYVFLLMDMYVKMHWAFYTRSNHLICHPVKTAEHYLLEGPLVVSFLCGLAPYYIMILLLRGVAFNWGFTGEGVVWMSKLRWIGLMHVIRIPVIIEQGRASFTNRSTILLVLYVSMTLGVCTMVAVLAYCIACPWQTNIWEPGDEYKVPACMKNSWVGKKESFGILETYSERWLVGVYYVCQTALVIGFGDMITLRTEEIYLLIMMMFVGFLFLRVIISDMTAAAVDSDEIRALFSERMKCLQTVMHRENANPKLIRNCIEHMKHTWVLSKGLQPQDLLSDLHPSLEADLFREYIGDAVSKVPLFHGVKDNILRTVCTYMRKYYFTRGERLMRRGNLEYEMYIIVDGNVWMAERNMEVKCSLGPGECMGETQMMYGLPRRYTAIAMNSVEVFGLSAAGFSEILDRYPKFKTQLEKKLNFTKSDIFERKVEFIHRRKGLMKQQLRVGFEQQVRQNSDEVRKILYAREVPDMQDEEEGAVEKKNPILSFIEHSVFSWGDLDVDLPFLYIAKPSSPANYRSFLVHPNCGFQRLVRRIVLCVCVGSPTLSTYQVFFAPESTAQFTYAVVLTTTWIFEAIMIFNLILQFLTPFHTVEGKYCKEHRRIAIHYLTITRFGFDFIATLPVHLYEPVNLSIQGSRWVLLNYVRVIRLLQYFRVQFQRATEITVTTFESNLLISVPFFFLMAHFLACTFYWLAACHTFLDKPEDHPCPEKTWTDTFADNFLDQGVLPIPEFELHKWRWYIRSMYWVVTTISTTGFGDITPQNLSECAVAIICIFCGAFLLSIILSQFTSGITSRTKYRREYGYQVKLLADYLLNIGLNESKKDQVMTWFNRLWDTCRGTSYREAVQLLPLAIQIEVSLALYSDVLEKCPLFTGLDRRFLRQVANRVGHIIFLAGFNVVNEGDTGRVLYIVARGRIAGYQLTRKGEPKLIRMYARGKCFGRLPALFYEQTYTKTYRAEKTAEVLTLSQKDMYHLCRNFPQFAQNLRSYILSRYDPRMGTQTIFSKFEGGKKGVMDVRIEHKKEPHKNPEDHEASTQTMDKASRVERHVKSVLSDPRVQLSAHARTLQKSQTNERATSPYKAPAAAAFSQTGRPPAPRGTLTALANQGPQRPTMSYALANRALARQSRKPTIAREILQPKDTLIVTPQNTPVQGQSPRTSKDEPKKSVYLTQYENRLKMEARESPRVSNGSGQGPKNAARRSRTVSRDAGQLSPIDPAQTPNDTPRNSGDVTQGTQTGGGRNSRGRQVSF